MSDTLTKDPYKPAWLFTHPEKIQLLRWKLGESLFNYYLTLKMMNAGNCQSAYARRVYEMGAISEMFQAEFFN